jgi:hypothetical protein
MTQTLKAQQTARLNLFQRIERTLQAAEITAWQANMTAAAIDQLRVGDFDAGERTMMKAERPDLWEASTPVGRGAKRDADDLRKALEEAAQH